MPARPTIFRWIDKHPDFASMYATARVRQADKHYDELVEAARYARHLTTAAEVAAYKLFIDTLKWASARLRPDQYAEETKRTIRLEGDVTPFAKLLQSLDDRPPPMLDITPDQAESTESAKP